ncbi:GDSL-type esterase/lipase family protein [Nocardia stercoris]|uniref:GDSL-type esterase/lipase family protein n=1 Tax=Nocardia stercoris TaxID=2483361 RepID=UPI00131A47E8|nr:GDSL-type esterase/lipase family protein [Nocardia stercoris]
MRSRTGPILLRGNGRRARPLGAGFDQIVGGYTRIIDRLHAAGLRAHLATLLPASNAIADGITAPFAEPIRQRINAWVRAQQLSHSVIDFDAALRDPANPSILAARYAGPDQLHPNSAGHQRMAEAIDPSAFAAGHC